MTSPKTPTQNMSQLISAQVPYLRRYARALTGSQQFGDSYCAATLEVLLADPSIVDLAELGPRVGLFAVFHRMWTGAGAPVMDQNSGLAPSALTRLARLQSDTREALLLNSVEEFSVDDIARIMKTSTVTVQSLLLEARENVRDTMAGRIMIIEDEAIIALDLGDILRDLGHEITGIAGTHAAAVDLAAKTKPDMILADIQLADNSSGIDAVQDILKSAGDLPVIFVTAFPERLLTGTRPEPTFLITKPYTPDQIRTAVAQAMFFSSADPLTA